MLHIRSPEPVQLMAGSMYPLTISQVLSSYNLVNALLLSVSMTSAFKGSTYKWYHMAFVFLWLISLSIMPSGSIHVVKKWQEFLLSYDWIIFHCMYIYHIIFTHLSVGRTLGVSFFIFAFMNISVNEHRNTNISSRPWFHFLLDVCSEVKLMYHMVVLFLIFWGTSKLFSLLTV